MEAPPASVQMNTLTPFHSRPILKTHTPDISFRVHKYMESLSREENRTTFALSVIMAAFQCFEQFLRFSDLCTFILRSPSARVHFLAKGGMQHLSDLLQFLRVLLWQHLLPLLHCESITRQQRQ